MGLTPRLDELIMSNGGRRKTSRGQSPIGCLITTLRMFLKAEGICSNRQGLRIMQTTEMITDRRKFGQPPQLTQPHISSAKAGIRQPTEPLWCSDLVSQWEKWKI